MKFILILLCTLLTYPLLAQGYIVSGTIKDDKNNRLLDEVDISIYELDDEGLIQIISSNELGGFVFELLDEGTYLVKLSRQAYLDKEIFIDIDKKNTEMDFKLTRMPGYEFEATVKELLSYNNGNLGKELKNLRIEIYNNTVDQEIVVIEDDPKNTFKAIFERGNHYSILLRKKGYFAKRIQIYVDIEGCILCFEGLGNNFAPEIESATTDRNQRGGLLADIPMKKIIQDEAIALDNIYYDYDKWNIRADARPPIEKLVNILKRNPIIIELGSHTDSRGKDDYNLTLSQKRAESAVKYIIARGIKSKRITANGYGETQLINSCDVNVKCSEAEHQKNRRTEFKVTAFIEDSNFDQLSLKQIIQREKETGTRSAEEILILDNN